MVVISGASCFYLFFFFLKCIYFERMWAGEGHREGDKNPKQAPHSVRSLTWGSIPRRWDHDLSWDQESVAQPTEPPRGPVLFLSFFFLIFFNVYLFLRQRQHERGRVRERETQNLKQAPGSELSAQSLMRGSNSRSARSWPELKSDA